MRVVPIHPLTEQRDETLERFIYMITQTNIIALDKTLAAIRRSSYGYAHAVNCLVRTADRMQAASVEISTYIRLHNGG